jgi:hypothetical protein
MWQKQKMWISKRVAVTLISMSKPVDELSLELRQKC